MQMKTNVWKRVTACALGAVMAVSVILLATTAFAAPAERRGSQNYVSNQGELVETPLVQLPLGAVKATGWLENQLLLQKNGVTGHMHTFRDYNGETSAWLGASGENWGRGTYYFRGLVALAFALDDEALVQEAEDWVNAMLRSQQANGQFVPTSNNDWWPRMPALMALRDYYEAMQLRGEDKTEILDFMAKYFEYQRDTLPGRPLSSWAHNRGGDNIDSVYWLYNQLGGRDEDAWLLELGNTLYGQTQD